MMIIQRQRQWSDVKEVFISDFCLQCTAFYGNSSAWYLMLGQPRQALEAAKTATGLDPEFTKGWTRMARCCVMLGDTVTAKQALQRTDHNRCNFQP